MKKDQSGIDFACVNKFNLKGIQDQACDECGTGGDCGMSKLSLRVVIYPEDELWVAHSLEMDVIGVGATQAAALQELRSNIEAQLSYAKFAKINPFRRAPDSIQSLWDDSNLEALGLKAEPKRRPCFKATSILQWSKREVSLIPENQYQCA